MTFIKQYLVAAAVFTVIDMVWLLVIAKNLYKSKIGHLMADKANLLAAVVFYLLFVAAMVFFVISPAVEKQSLVYALGAGAFFGLVTYATYDLTNLATLRDWPLSITLIDLAWGTFITSTTCFLSTLISRRFT
jgi:uncharacterized membrane protein